MKTYNQDPNFSIIMPGGCNAKCAFCFNHSKLKNESCSNFDFIINLWEQLKALPKQFYQISITGNEPMLSPLIGDVMGICKRMKLRFPNILLTSNGTNLLKNTQMVIDGVHHINVSRHHYDEAENKRIFGGAYNVTDEELAEIVDVYSKNGVDVSLNCVINNDTTEDFINAYIDFAKRIGALAVRFRKENGEIEPTPVEEVFAERYPILWHGSCPVCRTDLRVIRGQNVYWKSSVLEPSDHITNKVFELVYDTDGKVYLDWNRQKPLEETLQAINNHGVNYVEADVYDYSCGGRNSCGGYNSCGLYSDRC